jgi:ABC-type uncharacterized transport system ATPase component
MYKFCSGQKKKIKILFLLITKKNKIIFADEKAAKKDGRMKSAIKEN